MGHRGSIPGRSRPFRDGWQAYFSSLANKAPEILGGGYNGTLGAKARLAPPPRRACLPDMLYVVTVYQCTQ